MVSVALCLSLAACSGSSDTETESAADTEEAAEETEDFSEEEDTAESETSEEETVEAESEEAADEAAAESEGGADTLTDADVIGSTYLYAETNEAYGFTTEWELTFEEDGVGTMFEPNDMMGDTTYTTSWSYADGIFAVTLTESDSGSMSISSMFDDTYTCEYYVYADGTFAPVDAGSGSAGLSDLGDLDGLIGSDGLGEETASDADYPNVAYASNSDAQVMDIYLPENATGSDAVIVVVHGGGFKFGSQTMEIIRPVIDAGLENGYIVASVDYRKSGESTFPGALSDVKAAVRYLKANAETYGINPDQIVIWGESAGAYLSLMTALTPDVEELDGDVTDNAEYDSDVAVLVDFYGPVEFYTMDKEYAALGIDGTTYSEDSSFESAYLGQAIGEDEEFTYTTWWGSYTDELPEDYTLRAWIQAGTSDTSVPYTQSENFAAALAEVIGEDNVSFSLIEGAEHEDDAFYTDENLAEIFAFLEDAL